MSWPTPASKSAFRRQANRHRHYMVSSSICLPLHTRVCRYDTRSVEHPFLPVPSIDMGVGSLTVRRVNCGHRYDRMDRRSRIRRPIADVFPNDHWNWVARAYSHRLGLFSSKTAVMRSIHFFAVRLLCGYRINRACKTSTHQDRNCRSHCACATVLANGNPIPILPNFCLMDNDIVAHRRRYKRRHHRKCRYLLLCETGGLSAP